MNLLRTSSSNTAVHLVRAAACIALLSCSAGIAVGAPGDTELVSMNATTGLAAGGSIYAVSLSGDGRYVAFCSSALTLVAGDTNGAPDVYVRDLETGTTERVSIGLGGIGFSCYPSISANGRYVAFYSEALNPAGLDLFVRDRVTKDTVRIPYPAAYSPYQPSRGISDDGRFVAFEMGGDVYLRDMQGGTNLVLTTDSSRWGYKEPVISGDGRYVLYSSFNPIWTGQFALYAYDRLRGETEVIAESSGSMFHHSISSDGRWVAYTTSVAESARDVNGYSDVYLLDRLSGQRRLATVGAGGRPSNANSSQTVISGDGRYVAFLSRASNLTPKDTNDTPDWFIKDMRTGTIERVARGDDIYSAIELNFPSLSRDGSLFAFSSPSRLVAQDTNSVEDTYVHETRVPWSLRPFALDYGSIQVGTAVKHGFTLMNEGSVPLPIATVELLGADRSQYALKSYCGATVEVGSRCWISVNFAPLSTGYKQANLHVVAGGIDRHRALRGTGNR